MWTLPTTTATDLVAYVSSLVADPGSFSVILLAGGVPLAFYVIGRFLGILPGRRGGRRV